MFFRLVYDDMLAQAAYLIGCQKTGEAIVIDPERDVDRYVKLAEAEKLRITAVAETHIHADFLSGARELAERAGAKVYVSGEGGPDWQYKWLGQRQGGGAYAHQVLRDGDAFQVGAIEFKAMHTPGHTPEHMCLIVTDRGGGACDPMGLLSGDFVFVGDVGRPDLLETAAGIQGGTEDAARALQSSLGRFRELPEFLQVWPAHGAGSACGKALGAVPQSTVGYEKRQNPAVLASSDLNRFISYVLDGQPEPPLYFGRMKRQNRDGPAILGERRVPRRLSAGELGELVPSGVTAVDARPWGQYCAGHLQGALHAPLNSSFIPVVGSYVTDEASELCLVVEPERLDLAVRCLVRIGLDRVSSFVPSRELESYRAGGGRLEKTSDIDVGELGARKKLGGVFVLDVRRAQEFQAGHIEGAANIAHTQLAARMKDIPRDRPVLVHCQGGGRSAVAAAFLRRHGIDATNVAGGFGAWEKAGHEVVR